MIIEITSIAILILANLVPYYFFKAIRKLNRGPLYEALLIVIIGFLFIIVAQVIRLLFPWISEPILTLMRFFYYAVYLVGDVFMIKSAIMFNNYAKIFTFREKEHK